MCSDTNFNTNFPTYWKQIIAVRIKLITHEQKLILLILFPHLHLQCITNADACINMVPYFHSIDSIWCHHIQSCCASISTGLWFHDIYPGGISKQVYLSSFARMLFLEFVPLHFVPCTYFFIERTRYYIQNRKKRNQIALYIVNFLRPNFSVTSIKSRESKPFQFRLEKLH